MKPVCENIGLDWVSQYKKIQRNDILNSGMVIMTIPAADGKSYETACLPLEYLNGWLFGIDAKRVKPEIRERLMQYQRECFRVLNAHFNRPIEHPRTALPAVTEQMPTRNELLQVLEMLLDRLREIHNWGGIEAERHVKQHFGKAPNAATYSELVKMVRWLHRQTLDYAGRPIVAGYRYPDEKVSSVTVDLLRQSANSEIMQAVAVHMLPETPAKVRRRHAEAALFETTTLHEVLLKVLENRRYENENQNICAEDLQIALMEAGRLHNFVSRMITD